MCEQFSKLGFCEVGPACHNVHWRGPIPQWIEQARQKERTQATERKLAAAKAKVKANVKPRPTPVSAHGEKEKGKSTPARRLFSDEMRDLKWKQVEIVRGESVGELALQEDFVLF